MLEVEKTENHTKNVYKINLNVFFGTQNPHTTQSVNEAVSRP